MNNNAGTLKRTTGSEIKKELRITNYELLLFIS